LPCGGAFRGVTARARGVAARSRGLTARSRNVTARLRGVTARSRGDAARSRGLVARSRGDAVCAVIQTLQARDLTTAASSPSTAMVFPDERGTRAMHKRVRSVVRWLRGTIVKDFLRRLNRLHRMADAKGA